MTKDRLFDLAEPEDGGEGVPPRGAATPKGRGAAYNPRNRFDQRLVIPDPERYEPAVDGEDEAPSPRTTYFRDAGRSAITTNSSPDVGFDASLNPYRGCEHGCIYCYARPTHEYFGLSAGLDFETRIFVKEDVPALLRRELASPRWEPKVLAMSGVTDPYQPVEKRLGLTRRCLEVLAEFMNPVTVITKNHLVTRDIDILSAMARERAAAVAISITTLDEDLRRRLEPRTSSARRRLSAVESLAKAGIPVGVNVSPVIPGLTEPEIPALVQAAADAGVSCVFHTVLRLPHAVAPLFEVWLDTHFPDRSRKVLSRIRALRGGRLNDSRYGKRMRGEGIFAEEIEAIFALACRRAGLTRERASLSVDAFRRPPDSQMTLFD